MFSRDGVEIAYDISVLLFERAGMIFRANADPDVMLDVEQLSFLDDIDNVIRDRSSFVRVGTLVSVIQRDLAGTETIIHDHMVLYANIRDILTDAGVGVSGRL